MDAPAINLSLLSSVARAIVRALGVVRALEFLSEFGGVAITLPQHHTDRLKLSPEEHRALRHALAQHLDADERFWCPKCDKVILRLRDEQIRSERDFASIPAIARKYRLTDRHIINICHAREPRTPVRKPIAEQGDLFPEG